MDQQAQEGEQYEYESPLWSGSGGPRGIHWLHFDSQLGVSNIYFRWLSTTPCYFKRPNPSDRWRRMIIVKCHITDAQGKYNICLGFRPVIAQTAYLIIGSNWENRNTVPL